MHKLTHRRLREEVEKEREFKREEKPEETTLIWAVVLLSVSLSCLCRF